MEGTLAAGPLNWVSCTHKVEESRLLPAVLWSDLLMSAVEPVNEYNVILKEQRKLFLDIVMAFKNIFYKYPAAAKCS